MNASTNADKILPHIPETSCVYCQRLMEAYRFNFKLRKTRITKVGDFTAHRGSLPQITVNHDLDPFSFLITFIHEVAHLDVYLQFGNRVESHGEEWKISFQKLLSPVMHEAVFPSDVLIPLRAHMINPKASTFSDSKLTAALRAYDSRQQNVVLLSQLAEGTIFVFQGRWFKKGKVRRTRAECSEMKSRRKYLVPIDVPVEHAQLSLL